MSVFGFSILRLLAVSFVFLNVPAISHVLSSLLWILVASLLEVP